MIFFNVCVTSFFNETIFVLFFTKYLQYGTTLLTLFKIPCIFVGEHPQY